jgi:hypothetical protein
VTPNVTTFGGWRSPRSRSLPTRGASGTIASITSAKLDRHTEPLAARGKLRAALLLCASFGHQADGVSHEINSG